MRVLKNDMLLHVHSSNYVHLFKSAGMHTPPFYVTRVRSHRHGDLTMVFFSRPVKR